MTTAVLTLEWFRAFVDLIKGIGWPIALVLCIYLFRQRLNEILPNLKLKHKDTELSFQIEAALEEAATLPTAAQMTPDPKRDDENRFFRIASISPKAAMLEAYADFEQRLRNIARERRDVGSGTAHQSKLWGPTAQLMRSLHQFGLINSSTYSLYQTVQKIRNRLVHESVDVKLQDALDFAQVIDKLMTAIDEIPSEEERAAANNLPYDDQK